MSNQCSIITYHYVRELPYTRFPEIKGLWVSQFKKQLDYLRKNYEFVTVQECINASYSNAELPNNAVLLTFDDGYIDHFSAVFPLLEEKGIQGCFFPSARAVIDHEVLEVNKVHFLLASELNIEDLIKDIYDYLDEYRVEYDLKSNDYYFFKLAQNTRFDPKEIVFVKHLLNRELEEGLRKLILGRLFSKYVTSDEKAFSQELYMSIDQLKCLIRNGMYVGNHGYNHYWLNTLTPIQQEKEIDLSQDFLTKLGSATDDWVMSYPHGGYDDSLISILKKRKCKLGLASKVGIAELNSQNAFTLERLDTNDFPKQELA